MQDGCQLPETQMWDRINVKFTYLNKDKYYLTIDKQCLVNARSNKSRF